MQKFLLFTAITLFSCSFLQTNLQAQIDVSSLIRNSEINLLPPVQKEETRRSSVLKDFRMFGEKSGVTFTNDALYLTTDNGKNWREIFLPKHANETIAAANFLDEKNALVILADLKNSRLEMLKSADGGNSWTRRAVNLRPEDLAEASLETVRFESSDLQNANITILLPSSSNFVRKVIYTTENAGETWQFEKTIAEIKTSDTDGNLLAPNKYIYRTGSCEGLKIGCVQETKIFVAGTEITPPAIKELASIEKANAKLEAENSVFAVAPDGAVRTSLNRGFDKCTAATAAQMQTWWNNSPFYDANIYISGRNRGCSQPQLTANWVNQVSSMGWGLIPTIVGYQSPCTVSTTSAKFSYDTAVAEQQGRGEADIAITDANNLGLTQGTVLYYDMERYDETTSTPGCRAATVAFLKGWTDRVKERGYISGTYGSPTNAVADWIGIPEASRMQAIWMARWDNNPSVWIYASPSPVMPTNVWSNLQRIKQYQAPHDETWGGVTFNIDGNKAEGPVAGIAATKNKPADFDGDGKTDISVFRPDSGVWYVLNSSNSTFSATGFGSPGDILAPGDYDGNGKTDYAVFRPSNGVWYIQNRIFRSQQFGISEDIPVPADYNGDGFTDIAVFRPSSGTWFIWNSSGADNLRAEQFGASGDKPAAGDFDGDGKADLAVFRPSNGVWYLMRSTAGFTAMQFGISTDKPVQADYDGDGKTDVAVYRPSNGVWYLMRSTAGFTSVQFGISTDQPAAGDFDGDGKIDVAVYRGGIWYILQSQNGFTSTQFGVETDRPITSGYISQN